MDINFNGFQKNVLTFECTSAVTAGDLVKMSASGKVAPASANDTFIGVCVKARDGYAAVQLSGAVKMTYSGSDPVCGYAKLAASADGVQANDGGREYLVVEVDTQAKTVTFII